MFSRFFINRPAFSAVVSLIIMIAGGLCVFNLPIEQYPKVVPTQIVISTQYSGASAKTISTSVASILENAINGVENMLYIQSASSSSGRLRISVFFNNEADPDIALVNVNNRVSSVLSQLPAEVQRNGVEVRKSSTAPVGFYQFYSTNTAHNQLFIANYVLLNVIDEIKRISGTGDVELWSQQTYAMRVWLEPNKLAHFGLSPLDVLEKIEEQNATFAPGQIGKEPIKSSDFTFSIITKGLFTTKEEFENIIIRADNGGILRLRDVARVELGAQDYVTETYYNDTLSVAMRVTLQPGANILEVAQNVNARLEELSQSFPEGLTYVNPYRPTDFIKASIKEVLKTFVEAIILVVIVIYFFLGNLRATIIPTLAIPVSIIGTFAGLYVLGFSVNLLTLFGLVLAIGIVVDDAIIVIENVERIMHDKGLSAKEATIESMREITSPVIAIVLVISAVFLPVTFMGGFSGEFYRQFAATIVISVMISGFIALTLTPTLCAIFLRNTPRQPVKIIQMFNVFFEKFTHKFSDSLQYALKHSLLLLMLFLIMLFATFSLFKLTPTSLVPSEDMGSINIHTLLPEGASLSQTAKAQEFLRNALRENPLIETAQTIAGYSFLASSFKTNGGVSFNRLLDWSERKGKGQSDKEIIAWINERLSAYGDALFIAGSSPTILGLDSSGLNAFLQSKEGGSPQELKEYTDLLIAKLNARKEFSRVVTSLAVDTPQFEVVLDRERASLLDVSISDIFRTMQLTFGSYYVNNFEAYDRTFRVILQAESNFRESSEDLREIFVKSRGGELIPLSSLVSLKRTIAPDIINRFNLFPAAQIQGYLNQGYSSGEAMRALEEEARAILPRGYDIAYAGASLQEKQSGGSGSVAFIFGLVFVFLILVAQYEKWLMPIAVLMAVPFGVFGAILATFLRGGENDIYFQVGLVVLIALSAKNAILIVEFATHLRENGQGILESAMNATKMRLRPIVMTSLCFCLGVLPLALSSGAGALSRQSIGTGVIGGMLGATFLAVFFVPLFYAFLMRFSVWFNKKRKGIYYNKWL